MNIPSTEQLRLVTTNQEHAIGEIQTLLDQNKIETLHIKMDIEEGETIRLDVTVKLPAGFKTAELLNTLQACRHIKTIEL